MESVIDCSFNIIKNNDLKIDIYSLYRLRSDTDSFFKYLLYHLNHSELDNFIVGCFNNEKFVPILLKHFHHISTKIEPDTCTFLFEWLVSYGINPHQLLESITIDSNTVTQYKRVTSYLKKMIIPYSNQFEKENKILYEIKDKLQNKLGKEYNINIFEQQIIFPLSREDGNTYLNYAFNRLNFDIKNIEPIDNGIGNYSWCFKLGNDLVLRFSEQNVTWNIPMFYRINDFVIRRCFDKIVISVCPYGYIDEVTNEDIDDALLDFNQNNLVLTDGNYASNFAVVDYEIPSSMFTDVCGITRHLSVKVSDTFKKKKVKLIDQDYIYFKNQEPKHYGSTPTYK